MVQWWLEILETSISDKIDGGTKMIWKVLIVILVIVAAALAATVRCNGSDSIYAGYRQKASETQRFRSSTDGN